MSRAGMRVAKRAIDVILGSVLALVAAPLIVVLAVVLGISLRTWPFFMQDRIGRGGRRFRFVKLRTMPRSAPRYAVKGALDQVRINRFCRFLRRRHYDELPQLFLVPIGRMSLVGPRPKMPDEHEPFTPDFVALRTTVRPGCTCLWQIGSHTAGLPGDHPEYDLFYLRNGGIRLDLWIIAKTVGKMLALAGPVDLDHVPSGARGRGFLAEDESVVQLGMATAAGGS